jgi:RNA polymerase sigma-70 factor (ECF subfamily)
MQKEGDHNDVDLFRQLETDTGQALEKIISLYKDDLLKFINRIVGDRQLANEICLDTLLALWMNHIEVAKMKGPRNYMYSIARNKAIDALRSESKMPVIPLEDDFSLASPEDIEKELIAKEQHRNLLLAGNELTPQEKKVYLLYYFQGWDKKRIAGELHVSENTVRNQLSSALKHLKAHLGKSKGLFLV